MPVRILSVSYNLPEEVPFGALATEIGREFLGATPGNSRGILGEAGIYMKGRSGGSRTESIAFFLGRNLFVYAFGASRDIPTEDIVKRLYDANCAVGRCAPNAPTTPHEDAI